jgi:hypothetical protein
MSSDIIQSNSVRKAFEALVAEPLESSEDPGGRGKAGQARELALARRSARGERRHCPKLSSPSTPR